MKRPAFQFYPDDWTGNAKLKRCDHAAKGVWIDVLCLMHDSEEYGVLRWSLREIAQAIGCRVTLLRDLAEKKVLKGADTGQRRLGRRVVPHANGFHRLADLMGLRDELRPRIRVVELQIRRHDDVFAASNRAHHGPFSARGYAV